MRVLLLGGTGFIGTPLRQYLVGRGASVATASRSQRADFFVDATDLDSVVRLLTEHSFDSVVNLMGSGLASTSVNFETLVAVNARFPAAVMSAILRHQPSAQFIHAASSTERSSDDETDESDYSRTKLEGAQALRAAAEGAASPVTLLRIHNTYGPSQPRTRFVAGAIQALQRGDDLVLQFPDRIRDFVFIDDVIHSISQIIDAPIGGVADVELGTGQGVTLMNLAEAITDHLPAGRGRVRRVEPPRTDPHPRAVARVLGGDLGTCVTTLGEGLVRTIGER